MTYSRASWDVVLAHQGGWDELLMFGTPVAVVILTVRWAERRAAARRGEESSDHVDEPIA